MTVEKIINDWKKNNFKPVYWLEGEEDYYIDQVMQYAEHKILTEAEMGFNLSVFYGKDANWADVVNACMRYPMFAERQVVLLKEAQQMRDIDKLEPYIEHPLSSTVFVVSYKEKKVDGRSRLAKLLKEKGELLSTKKMYESQLPEWTGGLVESKGYSMSSKAVMLLIEHIGNDLSRISNEIDKLVINLGARKTITEDDIELYIGVSKEYNAFELQDALAKKDLGKAIRIIQFFESNPKAAPIQLVLPSIYNYFSKVFSLFGMSDKSENAVRPLFYNNIFAARQALATMGNYGYEGVERVLLLLHEYNLKSVGVNDTGTADASLLKELAAKMVM
ncbi:MAG TPA: DNA polymerase III subunit delta [Chitinophagaceae bacterium]|jgi:DNA polymerase-3 subunit delta